MTLHLDAAIASARRPSPRRLGLAVATALTAAVALSLGAWQLHGSGDAQGTHQAVQVAAPTASLDQPVASVADASSYLVLVDSAAQAAALRQRFAEADALLSPQLDGRPVSISVVVAEGLDSDTVTALVHMVPDPMMVVDLRTR